MRPTVTACQQSGNANWQPEKAKWSQRSRSPVASVQLAAVSTDWPGRQEHDNWCSGTSKFMCSLLFFRISFAAPTLYTPTLARMETFLAGAPASVVAIVLASLPCRDVLIVSTALNKSITSSMRSAGADLWSALVLHNLRSFLPAGEFFDGPENDSIDDLRGKSMRSLFSRHERKCAKELCVVVQAAGAAAMEATWSFSESSDVQVAANNRNASGIVSSTCDIEGRGADGPAGFRMWAEAFQCAMCGTSGSAQRQCAGCAELMCLDCSYRCDADGAVAFPPAYWLTKIAEGGPGLSAEMRHRYETNHAGAVARNATTPVGLCAFSLCVDCLDENSLPRGAATREGVTISICSPEDFFGGPGLFERACRRCPKGTFCPTHVDLCIITCTECGNAACANCSTKPPKIVACRICNHAACHRPACWDHGERQNWYCMDCGAVPQSSVCAPGFKCVTCNALMTQNQ